MALTTVLVASGCAYFKDTQSQLEEAEVAMQEGDEARAEELYRDVMRSKGNDSTQARDLLIDLLINRGGRMLEAGQGEDAMPAYREALSLNKDKDSSRIAYARALMKVERYTEAIDVLMEGKGCRGCKTMVSVIYLERAQAGVRDGEYADALEDFDMAIGMVRDPLTVLGKVDVYTQGAYGTGLDAVGYLDHALRLMPIDQVGAQQLWWDKRTQVVYTATLAHETSAVNAALNLPDPRKSVPEAQRILDKLNLRMYAASLEIYAADYDTGTERGLQTYADAQGAIPDGDLKVLRDTLMGLFMQRAATHLGKDESKAARDILAVALELEPENKILNFQNIIATAARSTKQARTLLAEWDGDPQYDHMRAMIELVYVRNMLGVGQFAAARTGLERAERYAPGLLDVQLARAEYEATQRFADMRKAWYERYKELDAFSYPQGRVNYYGRSLAYLRAVQAKYDQAAQLDYLRMPAFGSRLEALEKSIKAFYPYEAELLPADQATKVMIVLQREEDGEIDVKIAGPKKEHAVKVGGKATLELELGKPGLAVVEGPMGPKPVFVEPGVKIIVKV